MELSSGSCSIFWFLLYFYNFKFQQDWFRSILISFYFLVDSFQVYWTKNAVGEDQGDDWCCQRRYFQFRKIPASITTFRKVWKLGSLGFTSLCTCTCRIYLLIHDLSPLWTLSKRRSGPGDDFLARLNDPPILWEQFLIRRINLLLSVTFACACDATSRIMSRPLTTNDATWIDWFTLSSK